MELAKAALTSFVLIDADWLVERARRLIERLDPSHVIIRRSGPPETHYLLSSDQVMSRLLPAADSIPVDQVLQLSNLTPTPLIDAQIEEYQVRDPCIVQDEGRIIGFYDGGVAGLVGATRRDFARGAGPQFRDRESGASFESAPRDFVPPVESSGQDAGRSLTAEFPEKIALNQTASLLVSIVSGFIPGASVVVSLPQGSEIDIVVQARRGFTIEGPGEGKLVVTGETEGLPLQFKLRGTAPGPGQIRVLAFHAGRPLGMITLVPVVVETAGEENSASLSREGALAPATVRIPDLSLLILETKDEGETLLSLRLTSANPALGYNLKLFGPTRLRSDPFAYFQSLFTDIERLPIQSTADKAKAELRLAAMGANLFQDLMPDELKNILWTLRASITSVQVQSDEPWIPWELCKLVGSSASGVDEGPFLCEAFQLTRWIPGLAQFPRLSMKSLALVVPDDSGLAFAAAERDHMLSLAGAGRQVTRIPATFLDVEAALASGTYDAWHFSGHGAFRNEAMPDRSAMILQGGDRLTPEDLSGRAANLGRPHPLVFLNACQIGQSGMSLTGMGGWASRFLNAGAGGFLGAYWSVYDEPALNFAKAFYARLVAGDPVGKAAHEARLASRASGDPTWLAYTVFADPLATIT
jgi:hypothetical protein